MKPAPFRYAWAGSLAEATALLAADPDSTKLLAGGQSLVPLLNMRLVRSLPITPEQVWRWLK